MKTSINLAHWSVSPAHLNLSKNEVHLWLARFDQIKVPLGDLWETLNIEERCRVQGFFFQRDQNHFILSHGVLRLILGLYLKIKPSEINFSCGPYGKPFIANSNQNNLKFNMAHSEEIVLIALTLNQRIGIDIEKVHDFPEMNYITDLFFSRQDKDITSKIHIDQKPETFFRLWTEKEAYAKALGEGLTRQNSLSFPSTNMEKINNNWIIKSFIPEQGYMAALAIESPVKDYIHLELSFEQFVFE